MILVILKIRKAYITDWLTTWNQESKIVEIDNCGPPGPWSALTSSWKLSACLVARESAEESQYVPAPLVNVQLRQIALTYGILGRKIETCQSSFRSEEKDKIESYLFSATKTWLNFCIGGGRWRWHLFVRNGIVRIFVVRPPTIHLVWWNWNVRSIGKGGSLFWPAYRKEYCTNQFYLMSERKEFSWIISFESRNNDVVSTSLWLAAFIMFLFLKWCFKFLYCFCFHFL